MSTFRGKAGGMAPVLKRHVYIADAIRLNVKARGPACIVCGRVTNVSIESVKLALNKALMASVHTAGFKSETWKNLMAMLGVVHSITCQR